MLPLRALPTVAPLPPKMNGDVFDSRAEQTVEGMGLSVLPPVYRASQAQLMDTFAAFLVNYTALGQSTILVNRTEGPVSECVSVCACVCVCVRACVYACMCVWVLGLARRTHVWYGRAKWARRLYQKKHPPVGHRIS